MKNLNALNCVGEVLRPEIEMMQCPKHETCNANICPLDRDWQKRTNLKEDPTCFYLSESVKHGAKGIFEERGLGNLYLQIQAVVPAICSKHARIRNALERAKGTGSRIASGMNLKRGVNHD